MGSIYNSFEISELERTESLWLCHRDSLENIISLRSKQSSVVDDLNNTNGINIAPKSQNHNHVDKNFENKRQTINLLDFKSFLKLKGIADKPLVPQPDVVAPLNDQESDSTEFLSETSTSSSEFDESGFIMDQSDEETSEPVKLTDMMIYQTIRFMDYRRFSRRFNGIRKPVSNKKALLICLFCSVLALVPFIVFRRFDQYYVLSIQVKRGAMAYVSSLAFLGAAFLLAKIQLSLPLRLPVILSYLFMFITLIVLIVVRNLANIDKYVWPLLISYASVQIFLISLTKAFIYFVPILALHGQFFPCTEHFSLLKRTMNKKKLNITISRYNDYTSIWETRSCGFFMCIYRSVYRLILYIKRKINAKKRFLKNRDTPLFGHQMRYYGKVDSNNLPHGYGEWLEDHIYGERLHGFWWHGYPVGPFTSQEIGSGSIFVNNRVAFITDTHRDKGKRRYGVSSTECSISGYFFRQMPRTYFFDPEACSQMAHIVSFAKLPPYILPIVFNWKGHSWGVFSAFSYPKAVRRCKNPNIVEAFNVLITDLIKLGIKHVHFLVHSCGARIFFNVISSAIRNGLIMPVLSDEFLVVNPQVQNERLRMESAILINPDYSLEKFRTEEYFILRGYCDLIVMYVNNRDNCLWVSEFYNRERSLGKCIFEMCTSPSILSKVLKKDYPDEPFTMYDGGAPSQTVKTPMLQKSYSMEESVNDSSESSDVGEPTTVPMDLELESQSFECEDENKEGPKETKVNIELNEMKEGRRSTLQKLFRSRRSLNKYRNTKNIFWSSRSDSGPQSYENKNLWLDMDVIDTSMIDTNVDFLKHSFYQVKREIMDDIREVILLHTRADHRQSRLDRRRGNVYVFRVAPGDVRKLF